MESPVLTWMIDSAKKESIHRNVPNLTFGQSYLGHLERRKDQDGDLHWGYVIGGEYQQVGLYSVARARLERIALGLLPTTDTTPCGKCPHNTHSTSCNRPNCRCPG